MSYAAVNIYPNMRATVFELPEVVRVADNFKPFLSQCPNRDNVTFVSGDFFKDDLPPADLYSICNIMQDWEDDEINLILEKVYASLPSGERLFTYLRQTFRFSVKLILNYFNVAHLRFTLQFLLPHKTAVLNFAVKREIYTRKTGIAKLIYY